jgi:hypothetical protein
MILFPLFLPEPHPSHYLFSDDDSARQPHPELQDHQPPLHEIQPQLYSHRKRGWSF